MASSESSSLSPSRNPSALPPLCVLSLPGWQGSGPGHWQSRWDAALGHQRVEQDDWLWPRRGDWMIRLEEALLALPEGQRALLVAHSLGCHLVSAWAAHSQNTDRVAAAWMVAPPDLSRDGLPPQLAPWRDGPMGRLPFPCTVVFSSNDLYCPVEQALAMAGQWGGKPVLAGALGHLNAESGLADWDWGQASLMALAESVA